MMAPKVAQDSLLVQRENPQDMRRVSLDPRQGKERGIPSTHIKLPKATPASPRHQVPGTRQVVGMMDAAKEVPLGFLETSQSDHP